MSRWLSNLQEWALGSPVPAANGATVAGGSAQPASDLIIDRFRTHPQLLEVGSSAATMSRIRFQTERNSGAVAEMPRGLNTFLIRLDESDTGPLSLSWNPFGKSARQVHFVDGDSLESRVDGGTRLKLRWNSTTLRQVRIRGFHWTGDRATTMAAPVVVSAADLAWNIPDEWLTTDPLELRITPLDGSRQCLTECLLLPGRRLRTEIVFRRKLLPSHGSLLRRLQVEVRVPPPLRPPESVVVDWKPRDQEVEPAKFDVKWPDGRTSLTIDLPNISMRGDSVYVALQPAADATSPYAWFHTDESGYGVPPPDVAFAETGSTNVPEMTYVYHCRPPSGEAVELLTAKGTLGGIESLGPAAAGWPTTVAALARELQVEVAAFVRAPQTYHLYDRESELRAITERYGLRPMPSVVDLLAQVAVEQGLPPDHTALTKHWLAADDKDLDRWLAAIAAGADINRLLPFWINPQWNLVDAWQVTECSVQLEQAKREPLVALLPEVIAEAPLGKELQRAVDQELRLAGSDPSEYPSAALTRRLILAALADHWIGLLPDDADDRCRRIGRDLRTAPAAAARELVALRVQPGGLRLRPTRRPLFVLERERVTPAERGDWQLRRSAAADWYRTLMERRVLPRWPWHGLISTDYTAAALLAQWRELRPTLPPASEAAPAGLVEVLTRLQQVVSFADDELRTIAEEMLSNVDSVAEWLRRAPTKISWEF